MEVLHRERTVNVVSIKVTAEGKQRLKLADADKCLGCEKSLARDGTRGLCGACYQAARRAITKGQTTEAAMIRAGQMLESAPPGRPASNPLAKELAEK
jgi:hypothetical protein